MRMGNGLKSMMTRGRSLACLEVLQSLASAAACVYPGQIGTAVECSWAHQGGHMASYGAVQGEINA
jgi:hypothetical protein